MNPEISRKKPTKTNPCPTIGTIHVICDGVKWNSIMLTARKVRTPVSAGNSALRADFAAAFGASTAGVSTGVVTANVWLDVTSAYGVPGNQVQLQPEPLMGFLP